MAQNVYELEQTRKAIERAAIAEAQLHGALTPARLREEAAEWRKLFAGGMVPFDVAYTDACRAGETMAEAQARGCRALLDAFVEWAAERAAA